MVYIFNKFTEKSTIQGKHAYYVHTPHATKELYISKNKVIGYKQYLCTYSPVINIHWDVVPVLNLTINLDQYFFENQNLWTVINGSEIKNKFQKFNNTSQSNNCFYRTKRVVKLRSWCTAFFLDTSLQCCKLLLQLLHTFLHF